MSIVVLTSDTLVGSPNAGSFEYDGKVMYVTPQSTQRGLIPGEQFYRLDSSLGGANVATAQSVLGVGVTVSSSTVYQFEALYALSRATGVTSHTISLGFGGTATVNNVAYNVVYATNATSFTTTPTSNSSIFIQTASSTAVTGAITTAAYTIFTLRGSVSVNAGGTFIPQYTLSVAPGAYTTAASSYFLIYPIGTSGANTNVGTWA